jgi:signal transduction histidine kinase/CheY-specific phosphatase CheX
MTALTEYVSAFSKGVCGNVRDMVGCEMEPDESTICQSKFAPDRGMAVMIHFTGAIQGEYAVSMTEEVAAKMIGAWSEGMGADDLKGMRGDFGGFLKEALNTSVGQAIPGLERDFDALTFLPPVVIYGELEYPEVPAGKITMKGEVGEVDCFFVLNMMGLELGERLQAVIQALGESAREASAAKRSVASMLEAFPAGLVSVDRAGKIRPGYGRKTPDTVGLDRDAPIPGMHVVELLGFDESAISDTSKWLEVVYDRWGMLPFKDLVGLSPIAEALNSRGLIVKPEWVPLLSDDGKLDGLMLMIEDVTEKRRVESEMKKLSRLHEENMELMGQIVNLEPDEIQDFVYDSSGLLKEAENIVETANRDRKFIDTLYRAVHTLKGNSGQFQFKGLQHMAMEIENDIAKLRDQQEWETVDEDGSEFQKIRQGIEDAGGYVRRLEELRGKLGQRDEKLDEKVVRSAPAVMTQLSDIEGVAASVWGIHEAGRSLGWNSATLSMLASAAASAAALREVDLNRMGRTLQTIVVKTAQRLGKKASFSLAGGGTIDVEVMRVLHRCLVHLVNNSLDHGLETPQDRLASGKLETGLVTLECRRVKGELELVFSDDGRGIDLDVIRRKAVEKGLMEESVAKTANDTALLDVMFLPGFTTREKVGEFSGRGVGLDMVNDALKNLGGTIHARTVLGKGSAFVMRLPLAAAIPSTRFLKEVDA